MNVHQIIVYLHDLVDDILSNKNSPNYIAHKVGVLIGKLREAEKEELKFNEIIS